MKGIVLQDILYLGPPGTNTHMAAEIFIKTQQLKHINLIPKRTIKSIIADVDNNPDLAGIIPIENSIEGFVRETFDNIIRTKDKNVVISKEMIIPIKHCLISKAEDFSSIKTIISHPQAIAQCQKFIMNNFGDGVKIVNAPSTSDAVVSLLEKDVSYAAIGNEKAAEFYNVPIRSYDISDEDDNKTRFVFISRACPSPSGHDKTSIVFSADDKPGSLVKILEVFGKEDVNLSYLESRPAKKDLGQFGPYIFFADCDVHCEDEKFKKVLCEIKPFIGFYRFIGSYPAGSITG